MPNATRKSKTVNVMRIRVPWRLNISSMSKFQIWNHVRCTAHRSDLAHVTESDVILVTATESNIVLIAVDPIGLVDNPAGDVMIEGSIMDDSDWVGKEGPIRGMSDIVYGAVNI